MTSSDKFQKIPLISGNDRRQLHDGKRAENVSRNELAIISYINTSNEQTFWPSSEPSVPPHVWNDPNRIDVDRMTRICRHVVANNGRQVVHLIPNSARKRRVNLHDTVVGLSTVDILLKLRNQSLIVDIEIVVQESDQSGYVERKVFAMEVLNIEFLERSSMVLGQSLHRVPTHYDRVLRYVKRIDWAPQELELVRPKNHAEQAKGIAVEDESCTSAAIGSEIDGKADGTFKSIGWACTLGSEMERGAEVPTDVAEVGLAYVANHVIAGFSELCFSTAFGADLINDAESEAVESVVLRVASAGVIIERGSLAALGANTNRLLRGGA